MKTGVGRPWTALGLLLVLCTGQAAADFSGYYAIAGINTGNWVLSNPNDISPRSKPNSVEIASDVSDDTVLTVTAQQAGMVSAQLNYTPRQSGGAGYVLNGNRSAVSKGSQNVSFLVKAGDSFGFYVGSTPARYAPSPKNPPGTLNISNFSPPSSPTCASGAVDAPIISKVVPDANSATVMFNYCPPEGQATSYTVTAQPGGLSGSGTATPLVVNRLDSYSNYSFVVTATAGGKSVVSAPMSAKTLCAVSGPRGCVSSPPMPDAPTITDVTVTGRTMRVNYNYSGPPQTLTFQAQATSTSTGTRYDSAQSSSGPLTIGGLPLGQSYSVVVVASNTAGWGTISNPLRAGLPQLAITSLVAGNQSARISFTTSNGSDSDANISLAATPAGGGQPLTVNNISSPYLLQGLSNGTTYTVMLTGSNRYGRNSSDASTPFTPGTVPGAPTNLEVQRGNRQATVVFQPPLDNGGSPITKYKVVVEPGNIVLPVLASPAVVQGLKNGLQYNIRVMATNAWGDGLAVSSGPYMPGTLPPPPMVQQIEIGNSEAQVFFNPPQSPDDLPITGYTVTATPPPGTPGGPVTANGKASPLLLRGLVNGVPYQLTMTASNVLGQGPQSAGGQLVTTPQPDRPVVADVGIVGNIATVSFYQGQPGHDPASNYRVEAFEATPNGAVLGTGLSVLGNNSPLVLPPLPWGKQYRFTVTAFNPQGPSVSAPTTVYGLQRNRWLSTLSDSLPLNLLMVPGTHDSASYDTTADLGETQDWDIAAQLDNGIRFLDIRVGDAGLCRNVKGDNYPFELRHGFICLGNFQTHVMDPVNNFLLSNPREVVMMSIKDEDDLNVPLFMAKVIRQPVNSFITQAAPGTLLGAVRGKVVLFDRLGANTGVPWAPPQMRDQDDYDLDNNCFLEWYLGFLPYIDCSIDYPAKARKVIEFLNLASQQQAQGVSAYWINFASAQWKGMYIGNSAEVANAAVTQYFHEINSGYKGQPRRFGSTILMDYPNRQGDQVINSLLNFNRMVQ